MSDEMTEGELERAKFARQAASENRMTCPECDLPVMIAVYGSGQAHDVYRRVLAIPNARCGIISEAPHGSFKSKCPHCSRAVGVKFALPRDSPQSVREALAVDLFTLDMDPSFWFEVLDVETVEAFIRDGISEHAGIGDLQE